MVKPLLAVMLGSISSGSLLIGLFLLRNPALAIEIQRKFYEKINWRIEPISMQKEIGNTKSMGVFLIALAVLVIIRMIITR